MKYLLCLLTVACMLTGCVSSLQNLTKDWNMPFAENGATKATASGEAEPAKRSPGKSEKPTSSALSKEQNPGVETPANAMKTSLSDPIMADQF